MFEEVGDKFCINWYLAERRLEMRGLADSEIVSDWELMARADDDYPFDFSVDTFYGSCTIWPEYW